MISLTVLIVSVCLFPGAASSQTFSAKVGEDTASLTEKARVYRQHIAKQQRNIQLMKAELERNPDHPDTTKLNDFFATADGVRTGAFDSEPKYIRDLIDRLERDKFLMAQNLTNIAQYPDNIAKAHFLIEIERSQKFIAMLRKQLKLTEASLAISKNEDVSADSFKQAIGQWRTEGGGILSIFEDDGTLTCVTKQAGKEDLYKGGAESLFFTDGKTIGNKIVTDHGYSYFFNSDVAQWRKKGKNIPEPYPTNHFELSLSPDGETMNVHLVVQKYSPSEGGWATFKEYGEKCRTLKKTTWTRMSSSPF